jgi:hypothetical protein
VDETSRKAGFGVFPVLDHRWKLEPVGESDSGTRLTYRYDAAKKRAVWATSETGIGYRVVMDDSKDPPATADWTARVDEAGITGARKDNWVWDYSDKSVNSTAGGVSTGGTTAATVTAALDIQGPDQVTFLGSYYWTGRSIYTQVSIRQLKEVDTRTHPARLALDPELAAELAEEEAELAEEIEAS